MNFFGPAYGALATETFRILALTSLVGSCNYLVDSMLIARDRSGAYLFMNGANALLVLVCVGFLLHRGLAWGAVGWAIGQAASLALGLVVVAFGGTGQHRRRRGQAADAEAAEQYRSGRYLPERRPDPVRRRSPARKRQRRVVSDGVPDISGS
jgi:Na+-driven multidrug efflux pump